MAKLPDKQQMYHAPRGFRAGGHSPGTPATGGQKIGIIVSDKPAVCAAVTTTNVFAAPPIELCRQRLEKGGRLRGVVVNSGNANAATGAQGMKDARAMAAAAARALGVPAASMLVASTGVIGQPLKMDKVANGIERVAKRVTPHGWENFSEAILTTDLCTKVSTRRFTLPSGEDATVLGMAKGSGMIRPDMATMLAFVATDFPVTRKRAQRALEVAVNVSFHCLTVDGQSSTNDMVLMMSSGAVAVDPADEEMQETFERALISVCEDLARQVAADGEGASKLVTIYVEGAKTDEDCRRLGMEVANSPLVKTAIFGEDPNWGRIIQAIGQAGVAFDPKQVSVQFQGVEVLSKGAAIERDRVALRRKMKSKEIEILIRVGKEPTRAEVWTCDLTHGYIDINTHYS